ncbi:hypothetical protein FB45DRAFT_737456 [Roridomyces roridus]|uniref:Uncharacterized protein n=1 Tax=Roridomyces roridus TaxID=1738132 RepID=A0AAD7CBL0_9AGAR|nr:hypothetical protein FB45DRAFT_735486 [Roridomyces roridus]KAJ7644529.1 hypothetical protein FB45DRAFT_737456 [Roridomyces roridus]
MDNAGNCNTTASNLVVDIPSFRGMLARGRCFTHILQIVARTSIVLTTVQTIIAFFFKQATRKKTVKAKKGSAKRSTSASTDAETDETEDIVIWEADPTADAEDLSLADDIHEPEDDEPSTAQDLHDEKVSGTLRSKAVEEMRRKKVVISPQEEKDALKLFPKIVGLAKKVHDSRPLHTEFVRIIQDPETKLSTTSNVTELARRNATRWGSEYKCLQTRAILKPAVEKLLADKNLKLGAYKLNPTQSTLAVQLEMLLQFLEAPTKLFQSKNRPLIIDVLPEMEALDYALDLISKKATLCNVTRVAARGGLLALRKYYALLDECEAYRISIVLCPDRKLQWFRERGWDDDKIKDLRSLVVRRFTESYKTQSTTAPTSTHAPAPSSQTAASLLADEFRRPSSTNIHSNTSECDNIHTYLDSPLCTPPGTVIQYWNERLSPSPGSKIVATPDLARFGLSFCSCPGRS